MPRCCGHTWRSPRRPRARSTLPSRRESTLSWRGRCRSTPGTGMRPVPRWWPMRDPRSPATSSPLPCPGRSRRNVAHLWRRPPTRPRAWTPTVELGQATAWEGPRFPSEVTVLRWRQGQLRLRRRPGRRSLPRGSGRPPRRRTAPHRARLLRFNPQQVRRPRDLPHQPHWHPVRAIGPTSTTSLTRPTGWTAREGQEDQEMQAQRRLRAEEALASADFLAGQVWSSSASRCWCSLCWGASGTGRSSASSRRTPPHHQAPSSHRA